jgi:hypothetical protein
MRSRPTGNRPPPRRTSSASERLPSAGVVSAVTYFAYMTLSARATVSQCACGGNRCRRVARGNEPDNVGTSRPGARGRLSKSARTARGSRLAAAAVSRHCPTAHHIRRISLYPHPRALPSTRVLAKPEGDRSRGPPARRRRPARRTPQAPTSAQANFTSVPPALSLDSAKLLVT